MRSNKGFTLIELMIVVVIIGILAAIAVPKFSAVSKRAKEAEASPVLKQLYTLQERHQQKTGKYATRMSDLEGASVNFADAEFYNFSLGSSDGDVYVACAVPRDAEMGLKSFRVTQGGEVTEGAC